MRNWASLPAIAAVLLFVGSQTAGAERAEGRFERTLSVSAPVQLVIGTGSGAITIRKGDSSTVRIQAQIRTDQHGGAALVREIEQNPPVRQTENIVSIGTEVRRWDHVNISYEVAVPTQTQVNARTGAGAINVYDVRGPLDAATGSGAIRAENIGGPVNAKTGSGGVSVTRAEGDVRASTGSGSMDFTDIKGSAEAQTGSGSVSVSGATGRVRAHTGSGRIRVAKAGSDVDAQTGSGGIDVDGRPKSARWELRTSSGPVNVTLPPGAGFELDAHTGSGRISTTHQLTKTEVADRHELRGAVGRSDNRLLIRTSNGSIRID